uniref:IRG-type G domain-containing protein n=1 Tax=Neogobius melanostomus TaxID=47308 RepID=A0A8C6UGB5_9GOBI
MADNYEKEIKTALQKNDQALAAKKAKMYLDKMNNILVNIAITGEGGAGKSTLVNALRGIRNVTEGAAPTGVVETTMKPTEYLYPEHANIRIWDLPGVGTTKFKATKYLKKVGFEKYDFFIIVSNDRFRENDAKLAKEIQKMKKKFYFVRSKIDNSINSQKEDNPNVQEEEVLNIIRNYCTKGKVFILNLTSPKIFLVYGLRLHLYEFEGLRTTLMEELPEHQRDALLLALPITSLEAIEQKKKTLEKKIIWFTWKEKLKTALQNKDQAQVAEMAQGYLDKMKNVSLNIAITGKSGSGKSTLVNALRNIENDTEGASPTGAVETTMVATEYPYPEHPNIRIWDLPGIGTLKFRFYFVRSKIDNSISSQPRRDPDDILKSIRDNCTEGKVFLNLTVI